MVVIGIDPGTATTGYGIIREHNGGHNYTSWRNGLDRGLEWLFARLAEGVGGLWPVGSESLVRSLLVDGVIAGVGGVTAFLPNILLLYAAIAFLEDSGYMARAAFLMDHWMHRIGLHGKSFIPMCLGFGCNVPAVLGARIIETRKAHMITLLLIPFVPCTARLAVLTLVSAAIFRENAVYVSWSILALNIVVLGIAGVFVNKTLWKQDAPFIMELPIYHRPDLKTILMVIRSRTVSFVRKAGTVILGVSLLIWLLSYFPTGNVEESLLASVGKLLQPLGVPLGLDWKMITALLTGLVAKENVVATLGVLYSVGRDGLSQTLPTIMSQESAAAFLVVMMLFIPCAATMAAIKQESRSWGWVGASVGLMLVIAFVLGVIVYQVGTLIS